MNANSATAAFEKHVRNRRFVIPSMKRIHVARNAEIASAVSLRNQWLLKNYFQKISSITTDVQVKPDREFVETLLLNLNIRHSIDATAAMPDCLRAAMDD